MRGVCCVWAYDGCVCDCAWMMDMWVIALYGTGVHDVYFGCGVHVCMCVCMCVCACMQLCMYNLYVYIVYLHCLKRKI